MSRNITPEEFQLVYELVFPLHPREDVALRVTMDACDYLRELERNQARRTRSERHWKADMTQEQLLQYAAYTVSYYRELDQESPKPLLPPFYQPTREDRIVRYVKHILFRTYLLNSRSLAIGIGCLLYGYKPSEIADLLFLFEERSLRTVKMRLAEDLRKRFVNDDVVSPDGKSIRTIAASDNDRLIVEGALKAFTPWGTDHLEPPTPGRLMLDILSDEENPISEWQRKHALIDPECVGLARLINEFNKYVSSNPIFQRLADPRGNLMVPDFGGGPQPSLDRFRRRLLSDSDKMMLNERRRPSGPWAYLAELFIYLSDFGLEDRLTDWPISMNFLCYENNPTTLPDDKEHDNHEETMFRIYGLAKDPSEYWTENLQTSEPGSIRFVEEPVSNNFGGGFGVVIGCGGLGQQFALSLSLLPTPSVTFPPLHIDEPRSQYGTTPRWIMCCGHVGADDEQSSASRYLRMFEVFEELDTQMTRYPQNRVSRPDFVFGVDSGSMVWSRVTFAHDKQMESSWVTILDVGMSWSAISASVEIMESLMDLNQYSSLVLTMNQTGEWLIERKKLQTIKPDKRLGRTDRLGSSGPLIFHFTGHGCGSLPEPSCFTASHYGERSFTSNEIDGAICVCEAKYKRSQTQRHRPAHNVRALNAEMESPKHYDHAGAPFINQSRPTEAFTFQGL